MSPRTNARRRGTERVVRIAELLWAEYGDSTTHERTRLQRDPLDSLVKTILSQNTNDRNSDRAFASLKQRFPTWDKVLRAPVTEVEEAVRVGGLAQIKAPRIKALLAAVRAAHGALDLSALHKMPAADAHSYLLGFDGVGRKTAACVLLFALQQPVFPVDTHCLRIGIRLRLLPPGCSADLAHDVLNTCVPDEWKLRLHVSMVRHGRDRCRPRGPRCDECVVRRFCSYVPG